MGIFDGVRAITNSGKEAEVDVTVTEGMNKSVAIEVKLLEDACLREIKVFEGWHKYKKKSHYYGEGYQALSQSGGLLKKIVNTTGYTDAKHYKMPTVPKMHVAYGYMYLIDDYKKRRKKKHKAILVGATTCNHYRTEIRTNRMMISVAQILENVEYKAGDIIKLENMFILEGKTIEPLIEKYSECITAQYAMKTYKEMPSGWCSWYCIGPDISEDQIFENVALINSKIPKLKYVQIDDGYQPFMGDWLETGGRFPKGMSAICNEIKNTGLEPAIWVAPFIASEGSKLFDEHKDYFVKDEFGQPLCSSAVTFAGWRDTPWYFLDVTNPDALAYIKNCFSIMYNEWGVRYFKLDANVWGALPFGKRFNQNVTSVEAYRLGMDAIWDAVDNNAFIVGCNAPLMPSLGLVSAMRVTGDVAFGINNVRKLSSNCFDRNWMNGKLWINDPDCIVMKDNNCSIMWKNPKEPPKKSYIKRNKNFYKYNNIYVRASGGLVMASDLVEKYSQSEIELLERIASLPKIAAKFGKDKQVGIIEYDNKKEYCLFCREKKMKVKIDLAHVRRLINMYENKTISFQNKKKLTIRLKKNNAKWIMIEYNR